MFDPENQEHLDALSDWSWETEEPCALELTDYDDEGVREMFARAVQRSRRLTSLLEARRTQFAYGRHEGPVYVLPTSQRVPSRRKKEFYYELNEAYGSNVVDFRDEDYDSNNCGELFDKHTPLPPDWPSSDLCFYLTSKRPRLMDFLRICRGNDILICSERVCEVFKEATRSIQTFPVPVARSHGPKAGERISGYFVVVLYEKLDCIAERYRTPPPRDGAPLYFDPARGYKLIPSVVAGHDVFRLNYEYYRLLVSQRIRDTFDEMKVTGVEYLKRELDE